MNDEKVMRIIEEWWDEEQRLREGYIKGLSINPKADVLRADRLAMCRNQLAVAAGLDAEPGK